MKSQPGRRSAPAPWGWCGGCGRERRLATGGVMCGHNRWDPATRAMVACEGSGQEPTSLAAPRGAGKAARPTGERGLVRGAV